MKLNVMKKNISMHKDIQQQQQHQKQQQRSAAAATCQTSYVTSRACLGSDFKQSLDDVRVWA